jgi:hypothetical protein
LKIAAALSLLLLGACARVQLDTAPPAGYDLSGTWLLVEEASEDAPSYRRLRAQGGMMAFIAQDFPVLRAREMHIEQSADSMGIDYVPGGYRDVSWGTRNLALWEVRAGWHEGRLLILSKASDARAQETLTMQAGGERLVVDVRIDGRGDDIAVMRVFRRAEPG